VTVRPPGAGDARALAALNRFVHDVHLARRPEYFKAARAAEAAAWFRDQLGKPTTAAWIADDGGAPIGYVLTFFQERVENTFHRARRWLEIE